MQRPELTDRQAEIFEFICARIEDGGFPPTVREIGQHFGIRSPNGVMCHLKALEKKGLIARGSNLSRTIHVCGSDGSLLKSALRHLREIVQGGNCDEAREFLVRHGWMANQAATGPASLSVG